MKTKTKYGVPATYWIPEFKFPTNVRAQVAQHVKRQPREFYDALAEAVADFKAWTTYRASAPTGAEAFAELVAIGSMVQALQAKLSHSEGLSGRARQMIEATAYKFKLQDGILDSCSLALTQLDAAIQITMTQRKATARPGRRSDPKIDFAAVVFQIMRKYGLNPKATVVNPYEKCLQVLMDTIGEATGADNLHRIALSAAKHALVI